MQRIHREKEEDIVRIRQLQLPMTSITVSKLNFFSNSFMEMKYLEMESWIEYKLYNKLRNLVSNHFLSRPWLSYYFCGVICKLEMLVREKGLRSCFSLIVLFYIRLDTEIAPKFLEWRGSSFVGKADACQRESSCFTRDRYVLNNAYRG